MKMVLNEGEVILMDRDKILIIDDSIIDCKIMKRILLNSNSDYDVIFNHDGKNVVQQITREDINVIILDLLIESIDGIDVMKEIKSNPVTSDVPIIICSAVGDKETIKHTLMLGANDYFEKPLNEMAIEFGFSLKVKNVLNMKHHINHVMYLKNHDELTGIGTRKYFETELQRAIDKGIIPLSVIIMDVNGLKVINDAYGHDVGDKVLIEISRIIDDSCKEGMCSARWGSDEMVLLLPHANIKIISHTITNINKKINDIKTYHYDISFGWAIAEENLNHAKYLVQIAEDNLFSNKILDMSSVRSNMIETIVNALHQKNPREEMHSQRVSEISEKIAMHMGFSEYEIKRAKLTGLLHDIGKISIDEDILNKPGKLNENEWIQIRNHPEHGFKILSTSIDTMEIANAVLAHHERWDGKGYPKGISSDNIPIMARIISVADSFDAITSIRSYRESINEVEAIKEIVRCSSTQFDPIVVDAFIRYMEEKC